MQLYNKVISLGRPVCFLCRNAVPLSEIILYKTAKSIYGVQEIKVVSRLRQLP